MIWETRDITETGANALTMLREAAKDMAVDRDEVMLVLYNWVNGDAVLTTGDALVEVPELAAMGVEPVMAVTPDGEVEYIPLGDSGYV